MAGIASILAPVDFSHAASAAVGYGREVAARFGSVVSLLYVAAPPQFEFAMAEPATHRYAELAQSRAQAAAEAMEHFSRQHRNGIEIRHEVREGDPAEVIVSRAQEGSFDLIVMPTRGRSAIQRWLHLGSVTAKVLARAECPVITAVNFPHAGSSIHVRRILCAIDLGSRSEDVLQTAADMARRFQSSLTVIHAVPATGETLEDFVGDQFRLTVVSRSTDRIREIGSRVGVELSDIRVEAGDAPKVVAATAAGINSDLIVLGRSTANDLLGRLRANAYEIIRRAPCPVMSV